MGIHIFRPGIAMIELIFAITVMGIVIMSIPMLISTASKSTYVGIQQESIALTSRTVNIILGYNWDENNTNFLYAPKILSTNSTLPALSENTLTGARSGTPLESTRRYTDKGSNTGPATSPSNLGQDSADMDDIDDFNDINITLSLSSSSLVDYIDKTVTLATSVSYISERPQFGWYGSPGGSGGIIKFTPNPSAISGTSNIKYIQVTLNSNSAATELNSTSITLYAFSCNIGSYKEDVKN